MKNVKKTLSIVLILAMTLALCACGTSTSAPAAQPAANTPAAEKEPASSQSAPAKEDALPAITLTYSNSRAENHYMNDYNQWLFDELKAQANITIEPYYSNTLVGATTPYAEVKDGVADMAWIAAGSEADHFDIIGHMAYFMWGCSDNSILNEAWTMAFEKISEWNSQYEGTVVLGLNNAGNQGVVTVDPVTTLDGFKGMVIRGVPTQTSLIEALGAENLSVASTEVLANMEKGVLDGAMGIGTITGFSLLEFCSSAIYLDIPSVFEPQMLMNEKSWNKLTAEQQDIVKALYKEYCAKIAASFDDWDKGAIEAGIEAGMSLNVFPDDELAKLQAVAYDLAQAGIQELNDLGYDGQGFYDTCRSCLEECCTAAGYTITEIG